MENQKILLSKNLLIIFFFIILAIPGIGYSFTRTGNFKENYYGRYDFISASNQFRYKFLKDRMFTNMIANQNGWLMLTKDGLMDYQRNRPFTKNETRILKEKLRGLCKILTEEEIYFVLFITPNKNTVYADQIPPEILIMDSPSNIEVVKQIWRNTDNCKLLDIKTALIHQRAKEDVYYKTDTHWNQLGAFIGYTELFKLLSTKFPAVDRHVRSDYKLKKTQYLGDMTKDSFSGIKISETTGKLLSRDKIDSFAQKWQTKVSKRDVYFTFYENQELPSAIIYHDSFIYALKPFLKDGFREAQQFRDVKAVPSVDIEYIKQKQPDVVILEITERFLRNLLKLPIDV